MAALGAGCARSLWPQRHTYALVKGRASSQNVFTPLVFPSDTPSPHNTPSFLYTTFSQVFPSTKLSSINYYSHLHLSGFTPLRKIPTVNHYLRNQDFQQGCLRFPRVIIDDYLLSQRFLNTSECWIAPLRSGMHRDNWGFDRCLVWDIHRSHVS